MALTRSADVWLWQSHQKNHDLGFVVAKTNKKTQPKQYWRDSKLDKWGSRETFDSEGNTTETRVPEYWGRLLPLFKCGIWKEFLHYIWLKKTRVQVLMVSYSWNIIKSSRHTYFQAGKPRQTGVCYLCRREEGIWSVLVKQDKRPCYTQAHSHYHPSLPTVWPPACE